EELEQFVRWHNEMDINAEGIEALYHMLVRVKLLQDEIDSLRNELQ
ncbi:MAG TPA: MerR family transcriptional regulator, partial [Porphyromonadaceae bacterium]|nr:MerR family transcriptional regulator [Porphyromonadaceae bacterium]